MFKRIIVPTDGSEGAWRAVVLADRLAGQCEAELELLHVAVDAADSYDITRRLEQRLEAESLVSGTPRVTRLFPEHGIADTIVSHFESIDGAALVMSSHGRGRTASLLGSVATDVVAQSPGPVVVVGPAAKTDPPVGCEVVVAVDGSENSESILGVAGTWGIGLHALPWVVSVADVVPDSSDTFDTAYPARIAHRLEAMTGRPAQYEQLHGRHAAAEIADFAESIDARLILASTHGRTGLARLARGSVAAALVRHARCPVVLMRPPSLPTSPRRTARHTRV